MAYNLFPEQKRFFESLDKQEPVMSGGQGYRVTHPVSLLGIVKVDPSVPRDEVWFETRTQRVKIVNLATPYEPQPDEWVGAA